ncbi:aldehyde oxidase and xanthine dehydrogenase molybdopterin binding protein, partial [mine drainage metagenome]
MSIVDIRAGVDADGRLTAWEFENVNGGAAAIGSPYRTAAHRVRNTLSRSPLPQGSYRSLAAVANNFAREVAIDELAGAAGRDPVEFRSANLHDGRLEGVLRAAAARAEWGRRPPAPGRGQGIAIGLEKGGRIATVADVSLSPDRRVRVDRLVSVFEAG